MNGKNLLHRLVVGGARWYINRVGHAVLVTGEFGDLCVYGSAFGLRDQVFHNDEALVDKLPGLRVVGSIGDRPTCEKIGSYERRMPLVRAGVHMLTLAIGIAIFYIDLANI